MSQSKAKSRSEQRRRRLLSLLADGSFHSGEQLAKRLRVSRGGIWKLIQTLRAIGIEVQSVPRQGYRLPRAIDLLDSEEIRGALPLRIGKTIDRLDVPLMVDSTNRYLADQTSATPGCAQVCLTEVQSAGRGRRGRSWVAPFASGICMSIGWQFDEAPPTFSALSLAVGVAAVRAFERCGLHDVGLKWPNDLLWSGRKLGGVLIEMRGESAGPAEVIIGIGINVQMPSSVRIQLAEHQAVLIADVHEALRDRTPTRNALAAVLIEEIVKMLPLFAAEGFAPYAEQWRSLDVLAHTPVKILNGTQSTVGIARGVDDDGTLLVDVNGDLKRFVSGEVSVRSGDRRTADGGR